MSKTIKSLKIMLPYLNDEYVVGNEIDFINQAYHGDNTKKVREYGAITNIKNFGNQSQPNYSIDFESGRKVEFFGVPVQIGY